MKTLFPIPKTFHEARRQSNIIERSKTLFTTGTGYTNKRIGLGTVPLYHVITPDGTFYSVDLLTNTCTCKGFEFDRDCKHRLACVEEEDNFQMWKAVAEKNGIDW